MRRFIFTFLAAISFLVFIPSFLDALPADHSGGGMHWDIDAQQWLPYPPETARERRHRIARDATLIPTTGAIVLIWLTQFLKKQIARDRQWRTENQSYGSDATLNPAHLPMCDTPIPLAYHSGPLARRRNFSPGASAIILLLIFVPICTVVVYFLLIVVFFWIWPPAI
ncbi:MAG TPA: hypothetical protein VIM11_08600 [Tepidisphaeraceae bacterium]